MGKSALWALLVAVVMAAVIYLILRQFGLAPSPAPHVIKVTVPDVNF